MASQLISFRLSDAEVEALRSQALPDESDNLVAQRLLRNVLNLSTDSLTSVDRGNLQQLVESIVDDRMSFVVNGVNAKLVEVEEKLEKY